jgi:SAM-dependent methyltransferase
MTNWSSIARLDDPAEIREWILTGYRDGKPFTPYVPTVALPAAPGRVLDFGCGLGRNFPYLTSIARHVVGFDLPEMIEKCRALAPQPQPALTSDWPTLAGQQFDLIVATLVLQHVEPSACRAYLADFARMAPVTYLLTRVRSDFGENVLQVVDEAGVFEAGPCVEVEHDPATHQLRVLGEQPFDSLRHADDGGHFEVLLRSRR